VKRKQYPMIQKHTCSTFEPHFCPPFEGPPYKKEGPTFLKGGANLLIRRGHSHHKEGPHFLKRRRFATYRN